MNKCDICYLSHLENGKMVCPYSICILTKSQIDKMLKNIFNKNP